MKKALSILLALTMALALALPAAASTGPVQNPSIATKNFSDMGDVKNVEAADVLVSAGVVSGTSSTTIDPLGFYTREQAAKIICYMRLGPAEAEKLTCTSSPYKDVEAGRWSARYISYLVENGAVSGMGDGTFDPTSSISGYEIGKMALCALGYGENGEYTGSGWAGNVAGDAKAIGLSAGCGDKVISSASLTRDMGMQIAFNALANSQIVEYDEAAKAYVGTGTTLGEGILNMELNISGDSHSWSVADKPVTDNYKNDPVGDGMPDTADAAAMYGNTLRIVSGGAAYTVTVAKDAVLSLNNADGQTIQSSTITAGTALPVDFIGKLSLGYSASGEMASMVANVKDFVAKDLVLGVIKQTYTKDGKDYVRVFDGNNTTDYIYTAKSKENGLVCIFQKGDGTVSVSTPENLVSG